MEKIDRQLLIKEISTRLPYGVKAKVDAWDEEKGEIEVSLKIYSINTDGYVYFEPNDYDIDYLYVDNCLLYLRPMTSMTEEEEREYNGTLTPLGDFMFEQEELFKPIQLYKNIPFELYEFFNSHHFDFRGLIEKGLALEAPEGMYN